MTIYGHFAYTIHGPNDIHPGEAFHDGCGGHILFNGPKSNPTVHYHCDRCEWSTTMTGVKSMPNVFSRIERAHECIRQMNELRNRIIVLTAERVALIAEVSAWDPIKEHVETSLHELQEHSKDVNAVLEQATKDGLEWYIRQYEKAKSILDEGDGGYETA